MQSRGGQEREEQDEGQGVKVGGLKSGEECGDWSRFAEGGGASTVGR